MKMKKAIFILITIFLLIFFISSIFVDENFVIDSLGRKINIDEYNRIGLINPAALKSLLFLDFDLSKIKAVDSYSIIKYKDKLPSSVQNLGDFNNPNLELIVKNKIDLLILDQSFPIQKLYEIEKLKIPYFVYSTTPKNYSAIDENLYNLSKLLKKEKNYKKLKEQIILPYEEKLFKLRDTFKNKYILFIVWAEKNITIAGNDSYLAFLAEFSGFNYSIKEKGWISISFEQLLTINPDYIIAASSYIDKNFFNNTIFNSIKAVKNKKIYFFSQKDEDIILAPSFDLWQGFYEILTKF